MTILTQHAIAIFNPYSVTATGFVYNSAGGTASTAGWQNAKYDNVAIQIGVATLNATRIIYQIEGKNETYTRPCKIYNASITYTDTIDTVINVTEPVKQIRVGIKANNTATLNSVYVGLIRSESR